MELLSKGTKLQYADTKAGTFKTLYGLQSTPDMGGDPEKVDVTNLADGAKNNKTNRHDARKNRRKTSLGRKNDCGALFHKRPP